LVFYVVLYGIFVHIQFLPFCVRMFKCVYVLIYYAGRAGDRSQATIFDPHSRTKTDP